jgi:hypothetical protein
MPSPSTDDLNRPAIAELGTGRMGAPSRSNRSNPSLSAVRFLSDIAGLSIARKSAASHAKEQTRQSALALLLRARSGSLRSARAPGVPPSIR